MARQIRLFIPQCPVVLELHGLADQTVFKNREAFLLFHAQIPLSAQAEKLSVHAYCLTPSVAMLMVCAQEARQIGRFVQNLNRHFSPALRRVQTGTGKTIWTPRFKSSVIQPGLHSLKACLLVEQLATRTASASNLATYPWSSYAAHAGVLNEAWLVDLPSYWQLGNTPFERQSRYRQFSEQGLVASDQLVFEHCLKTGGLWADEDFFLKVQGLANRSVEPRPRGRPPKRKFE